jgi:predicted amidohydrolase
VKTLLKISFCFLLVAQTSFARQGNRTIKIAAVQMVVNFCDVDSNLAQAERLIRDAFNKGAEWVIMPEFFTSAMGFHPKMLDAVSPLDGRPMQLFLDLAREYNGVIGGSFLAFRNGQTCNTFMLVFPDGSTFMHDKDIPSLCENYYYVGGADDGVLDTPSGSVGAAMCFEFIRSGTASRMLGRVDIVVGGSCWWGREQGIGFSIMQQTPAQFARILGVPVVHAAHAGTFHAFSDSNYKNPSIWAYVGETQIVDGFGQILARMSYQDGEGSIIAEVSLGEVENSHEPIPNRFWIPADMPQGVIDAWTSEQITGHKYYEETALPYYIQKWGSDAYARDGSLDRHYARPGLDTVCVTAALVNPLHHSVALSAVVTDTLGAVLDRVPLYDDGLHGDGNAGDSLWGCAIRAPSDEGFFNVDVYTDDITQGTYLPLLTNAVHFTTAGPVTLDSLGVIKPSSKYKLIPYLRNNGTTCTIRGAKVALTCKDPWVKPISQIQYPIPDLMPGANAATSAYTITLNAEPFLGYFNVNVEVSVDGWVYWTDSTCVTSTGVVDKNEGLPVAFALEQNYPNPFNPSTTIKFGLPHNAHVTLRIYNVSGQGVATLVDQNKVAGIHTVQFNGSNLASGVYLYRLQAGNFTQTRKFTLLR